MIVVSCPKCHDPVSLPEGSAAESRVECPLCHDEYVLSEILDRLPPKLIVLDAGGNGQGEAAPFPAVTTDEGPDPFAALGAGGEAAAAASPFAVDASTDEGAASGGAATTRPRARRRPRPTRKPKSGAMEVAKIVGGGILGLIIAQFIIWWGIGKDPFNLGHIVAKVMPFAVPEEFHISKGDRKKNGDDNSNDNNKQNNKQGGQPGANKQAGKQSGTKSKKPGGQPTRPNQQPGGAGGDPNKPVEPKFEGTPFDDIPAPPGGANTPGRGNNSSGGKDPTGGNDSPTFDLGGGTDNAAGNTATTKPIKLRSARQVTAEDLTAALKQVQQSRDAWLNSTASGLEFYSALARLAEVLSHSDVQADAVKRQLKLVEDWIPDFRKNANIRSFIQAAAAKWPAHTERTSDGIMVMGEVTSVRNHKGIWFSTVSFQVGDSHHNYTVVTRVNPHRNNAGPNSTYDATDRIALLGVIVDNPSERIEGFESKLPEDERAGEKIILAGYWSKTN